MNRSFVIEGPEAPPLFELVHPPNRNTEESTMENVCPERRDGIVPVESTRLHRNSGGGLFAMVHFTPHEIKKKIECRKLPSAREHQLDDNDQVYGMHFVSSSASKNARAHVYVYVRMRLCLCS